MTTHLKIHLAAAILAALLCLSFTSAASAEECYGNVCQWEETPAEEAEQVPVVELAQSETVTVEQIEAEEASESAAEAQERAQATNPAASAPSIARRSSGSVMPATKKHPRKHSHHKHRRHHR